MSSASQAASASDLDRALRANDLNKARQIVPEDWASAEQLFVSYLERAYVTPDVIRSEPDARTLAGRLADVFFKIIEFDFARSVVLTLDAADPVKRQQLIAVVRDYFTTLERMRVVLKSNPGSVPDSFRYLAMAPRNIVGRQFAAIADRFRALSFPRGEFWTLTSMINVMPPDLKRPETASEIADRLGDDLMLSGRGPYTEASLARAERLGLPRRQAYILEDLADRLATSSDPAQLEAAARYLERARVLVRAIPAIEEVNYWMFQTPGPHASVRTLPALWAVYSRLKRPADAQPLLAEALEISRPFGEAAQAATIYSFGWRAAQMGEAEFAGLVAASRTFNPALDLQAMRQLSNAGHFRPEMAEETLALAMALPDSHEQAATLEWYARTRETARERMLANPGRYGPAALFEALANNPFPGAFGELLEICLKSDETELVIDALGYQATAQAYAGDTTRSMASFKRAVDLADRVSNFKKVAEVTYKAVQSKLPTSVRVEFALRAVDAAGKANDPLILAQALRARALIGAGTSDEGFQDLQQALEAAEKSGDVVEQVQCLHAIAGEHVLRGEYRSAIEVLERAAEKGSGILGWIDDSLAYRQMTSVYAEFLGEPALALAAAERARQLIEPRTVSKVPPQYGDTDAAEAHFKLATLQRDLGRPAAALAEYAKALEFKGGTANWPYYHRQFLTSRAQYLAQLGDYEAALGDWDAVRRLMSATEREQKFPGGPTYQRAVWLTEVARVHALAGNDKQALALAQEAVTELNRDTSGTVLDKATLDTLVAILLRMKAPDEIVAFCDGYYKRILAKPLAQPVAQRTYLETLALADLAASRMDQARQRLLSAVDIDRSHPTAEIGGLAGSLLTLGKLETASGNTVRAKQYLLDARAAANPYDLNQIWRIERSLGATFSRLRDTAAATAHYERALTTLESVREHLRPEEFLLQYGEDQNRIYEEYAGLLAARALSTGQQRDAERAFQAAERKRTQLLSGLLATGWSRLPADAIPEQLRRTFDLEAGIAAKQSLLRAQFVLPADQRNAPLVESLESDLKKAQAEHTQLLASLAQGQYRYTAAATLAASLAGPVRAALGPSRVLVEYLVTDERSYACVVSASRIRVVPLAIGRASLRQQVSQLLAPFRQLRAGEVDVARLKFDTLVAFTLYRAIFAPVQPLLGSSTDVVIVPDDVLHVLPFDALVERAPGNVTRDPVLHGEFAGQAFLLRRYAISYLSSSAQLLGAPAAAGPSQADRRLFAMANPTASQATPAPADDDPLKRQLRAGAFGAMLGPLPGAEAEVQQIARYFARDMSTIVRGAQATETAYRAQAGQHAIVHFATHAVASDGQPLYSTLVLAPDAAAGGDGFLQAYEVLRTPLRADLVVLSGCETALGAEDWGQGLVGLVAAFQQAGARSVLATLWSIDEATADVMNTFYAAMAKGSSHSAALRQAKLQLLQQRVTMGKVEVSLAHPFFWAPFILVGAPMSPSAGR